MAQIFKAYDVRGRVDNGELDRVIAERIGAALARFTAAEKVAVGRDCRLSSPELAEGLIEGVVGQGTNVVDIGEVPTEVVYFMSGSENLPGAVITASHNPPMYNGIKLCGPGATPIGADSGLAEIEQLAQSPLERAAVAGTVNSIDVVSDYIDHLFSIVDASRIAALSVAVDGGNGMAGVVIPSIFERLDASLVGLYLEPDGTFPNHPADPLQEENLRDLLALMMNEPKDLGVAFDGDADRAFFVDDEGSPVSGSTTTALIARWFLQQEPGARIVHNLITSRAVPETVAAAGGIPVRTRVGHSFIKAVMAESGAVFGGEHSGHYYFRDSFRADSGMLATLVLLQVISDAGSPLSELRKTVEPYAQSGEINFHVSNQESALDRIERTFEGREVDRLDGLTIDIDDAWINIRPSNTEPVLRVNVEAPEPEEVARLVAEVQALLEEA